MRVLRIVFLRYSIDHLYPLLKKVKVVIDDLLAGDVDSAYSRLMRALAEKMYQNCPSRCVYDRSNSAPSGSGGGGLGGGPGVYPMPH